MKRCIAHKCKVANKLPPPRTFNNLYMPHHNEVSLVLSNVPELELQMKETMTNERPP
jgi:hypothetical protein